MEKTFHKYSSIENHYQSKFIDSFVSGNPTLMNAQYWIEEKIHGANFQIVITKDSVAYGSRTKFLEDGDKLYNFRSVIESQRILNLIASIQTVLTHPEAVDGVTVYGELCGKGVQGEIHYFDEQRFLVFDINVDGTYLGPKEVREFISGLELDPREYCVPVLKVADSLVEALDYDVIFNSVVSDKEDNNAEGVVIKPTTPAFRVDGKRFIIKKKNPLYLENKAGKVKKPATPVVYSDLQNLFFEYVNATRVAGIMSKHGEIDEPSQIKDYIKYVFEDAMTDLQKENEQYAELTPEQMKPVRGLSGKFIVPYLKKYL